MANEVIFEGRIMASSLWMIAYNHSTIIISFPRMEVIHRFTGSYPFQLEVPSARTYLEVLKQDLTEKQIALFRRRSKILKTMDGTNFVKLVKLYKEQSTLHLFYQYFPLSLEMYLQARREGFKDAEKDQYKIIYSQFTATLASIIDQLINAAIRTDIVIQNFVVADSESGQMKLFVDPDAEIIENSTDDQENWVDKASLQEFYSAQKKRIVMEFQELLQKYFAKSQANGQANHRPNFVINGCKLVFTNGKQANHEQKRCERVNGHAFQKSENKGDKRKVFTGGSPTKDQKIQFKRDLKEKTLKKLNEIKGVLNRYQSKPMPIANDGHKCYPEGEDEIVFRPEEITNDKTALLQQNQYLECLQNQIDNINQAKRMREQRQSEEKRADIIKQISQIQQKNKKHSQVFPKDGQTNNYHQYDSNSTRNDRSGNSEQTPPLTEERRGQKPNKYRMKIVTSHEIQIEGGSEPQGRQSDIRSIKNGLDTVQRPQRPKTVKLETQQSTRFPERMTDLQLNSRNSDIASKSRKINEIIEKIGSKDSTNQLSSSSHHPLGGSQRETLTSYKSNGETATDHEQDNFYDKIREAKQKAEHALKEYAKKKH